MRTKINLIVIVLIGFVLMSPMMLHAQKKDSISTDAKIDTIYRIQRVMYSETRQNKLANKKFGVEVNLFRLLISDKYPSFSGTLSFFDINRSAEVAFPILYQRNTDVGGLTTFTLDCHYRYFLNDKQNGFYISGFARYAHLRGDLGNSNLLYYYNYNYQPPTVMGTEDKLALGFGAGVRIFSRKGMYWGFSTSLGRYLVGENDKFNNGLFDFSDDNSIVIDIELLKFGWAF